MSRNLIVYSEILSNISAMVKGRSFTSSLFPRALAVAARVTVVTLAVALLTLRVTRAEASPFDPSGQDWEGYADFLHLVRADLGTPRVIVTGRLDWGALKPEDALLLVFPETGTDSLSAGAFVRAGGRIALLDDYGAGDDLLTSFDITRVPLPAHPLQALRDNPELPIADPGLLEQPLTHGVEHVVTNHATGLRQPLLTTVLRVRAADGPDVALGLSLGSGAGRLVALGDPSILMNAMLRYPGNRTLAKNLVTYLMGGQPAGRLYVLVHGYAETGTFAGTAGPKHDLQGMLERMRGTLSREGLPSWMMYWFSFIVAVGVLVWVIPRTTRTYRSAPPRFTRQPPLSLQGGAAGHAAALGAAHAYRGHAVLEWRRAFVEDLTAFFGLPLDASPAEVVRRVSRLGVVSADAVRALERLLLRMAEIDTMIAAKQTHALEPIRDDEVVATGKLVQEVLVAVHGARPE